MLQPAATLVEVLRSRAERYPLQDSYIFLEDSGKERGRLSYGELDKEARRIAASLQRFEAKGQRALLLFPAGAEFLKAFFGALYAGVIAIPAPPPEASRLKRTLPRLVAVAKDAEVSVVMSTKETLELVAASCRDIAELQGMRWLDIGTPPAELADRWQDPQVAPDDLAYLQYTSGSTTSPKGVMLSHRNVVHHCGYIQKTCEYAPDSISVTWLPYYHDYGLVEGLLVPLFNETPCYVMSPFAFLKRPFSWLQAISHHRATHTQAPNFAYDQCVRRVKPDQRAALDLRSLRSAGNGAEPINPAVLESFHQTFEPQGFRWDAFCPAYGLAEATLMVSCCSPSLSPRVGHFQARSLGEGRVVEASSDDDDTRRVTSCGRLVEQTRVVIVDPATSRRCAPDEVGEVWVSDPGVALGYWQRPEETDQTFRAYLADTGEGPFLRTGDLGFIDRGELFLTSRLKDVIIIAGTNHHPQDIEWTVERCHPALRPNCVAAFSIQVDGDERLVVAPEVERGSTEGPEEIQEVLDAVRRAVAEGHELQVHAVLFLCRGSLPKTASGKVQRRACWPLLEDEHPDVLARWVAERPRPSNAQPLIASMGPTQGSNR